MGNIVELNRVRRFTVEELEKILPIVRRITDEYFEKLQSLMGRLEALRTRDESEFDPNFTSIEKEINDNVQAWQTKLEKLGAQTKGLWIADFDAGDGYYCWKYPEEKIRYWHQYNDGFRGRVLLEQRPGHVKATKTSEELPEARTDRPAEL